MARFYAGALIACLCAWQHAAADASVDVAALLAKMEALEMEVSSLKASEAAPRQLMQKSATVKAFGKRRVPGHARFEKEQEGRQLTWATWPEAIADLQGAMNHMWLILCGAL
eukprot:1107475-Amphidinium_carterae.1